MTRPTIRDHPRGVTHVLGVKYPPLCVNNRPYACPTAPRKLSSFDEGGFLTNASWIGTFVTLDSGQRDRTFRLGRYMLTSSVPNPSETPHPPLERLHIPCTRVPWQTSSRISIRPWFLRRRSPFGQYPACRSSAGLREQSWPRHQPCLLRSMKHPLADER